MWSDQIAYKPLESYGASFREKYAGFIVLAMLVVPVLVGVRSWDWTAAALTFCATSIGFAVAWRRYRRYREWRLAIRPEFVELVGAQGRSILPFANVQHVFVWNNGLAARLVMDDGSTIGFSDVWQRPAELTKRLVSAVEANTMHNLELGQDLDFGEVKVRTGVLLVRGSPMPAGTTCEVRALSNGVLFTTPDGRTVDVPIQWVSHPWLVEELVNSGVGAHPSPDEGPRSSTGAWLH